MQSMKNQNKFDIMTITGFRYRVSLGRILSWFVSRRFIFWAGLSILGLIIVAPHNAAYGLSLQARFVYWPIATVTFVVIYIAFICLGYKFARSKKTRFYYSPVGIFASITITTFAGSFLVAKLTGNPPDLSLYKMMEVFFNMILACLFEGVFFAFSFKKNPDEGSKTSFHPWEKL